MKALSDLVFHYICSKTRMPGLRYLPAVISCSASVRSNQRLPADRIVMNVNAAELI